MEEIMSKTNNTSRPATPEDHRPLADSELDAVTGGTLPGLGPMVADKTGDLASDLVTALLWFAGSP
jgi:hypothetical protein